MTAEPTKSELRAMLREAVVNTGGVAVSSPKPPTDIPQIIPAMPTADQVARAIVAAARETGEDPIACASRVDGLRCRHYAMHALEHVFPAPARQLLARLVGCPGEPAGFLNISRGRVLHRFGPDKRAKWWNEAAFARVVEAIR